jgi:hypothetical protein
MGDVKAAGAQARVAGQSQKETDGQDRDNCGNEKYLQQTLAFQAAHEMPTKGLHLFSAGSFFRDRLTLNSTII